MTEIKPLTDVFYVYVTAEQMAHLQMEDAAIERRKSIHSAFLDGRTIKSIAQEYGISSSRVHQIIRKPIYHGGVSAWEQKIAQRFALRSETT